MARAPPPPRSVPSGARSPGSLRWPSGSSSSCSRCSSAAPCPAGSNHPPA